MSAAQFQNSIRNLVEKYIPEAYEDEDDTYFEIIDGRVWQLVFEDPSGVLDIWAFTPFRQAWEFDLMEDEFHYFLLNMAYLGPGTKMKYKRGYFILDWHECGPPDGP